MSSAPAGARSRVIVAVGPAAADSLAIVAATQLARAAGAKLFALFVEDTDLLRLAELPFAFEIGMAFATPRRLTVPDVERALKSQAGELKRVLAEMAGTLQLDFSFKIVRGRPAQVLLDAAGERDLVVLARTASRTLAHPSAASVVRDALRPPAARTIARVAPQAVAAVLHSPLTALRVLMAAHRFARTTAAGLLLLFSHTGAQDVELTTLVDTWLSAQNAAARMISLPDLGPVGVARFIADQDPCALFWPGDGESEMTTSAEALLAALDCPLIVVR